MRLMAVCVCGFFQVNLLQNQIESFQRQIGQSPQKPTISAPPVERSG